MSRKFSGRPPGGIVSNKFFIILTLNFQVAKILKIFPILAAVNFSNPFYFDTVHLFTILRKFLRYFSPLELGSSQEKLNFILRRYTDSPLPGGTNFTVFREEYKIRVIKVPIFRIVQKSYEKGANLTIFREKITIYVSKIPILRKV